MDLNISSRFIHVISMSFRQTSMSPEMKITIKCTYEIDNKKFHKVRQIRLVPNFVLLCIISLHY